jgi:hypothetical protein
MTVLSALLARDHVVPPSKIDEAIQRQVINGGDFETNLLEVGAILEDTLAGYCAAVYEAQAIGRDEIMAAQPEALAQFTREIAETHQLVPVRVEDGALLVAAAAPPPQSTREALETLVGRPLHVRITTPFRLSWALWKFYGTPLSPRLERLAQRLNARPSGSMAGVTPTLSRAPAPASVHPPAPPAASSGRLQSALAALASALDDEPEEPSPSTPTAPAASDPRARIEAAQDRDEIVAALLDFVQQRVTYCALFVVHGEIAEGLDARGQGLDAESVRRIAVPLDAPGIFRAVRERGEPFVGALGTTGTDAVIKADLGRAAASTVALLPVHIGGRVVLILWVDNGSRALDLAAVDEVARVCGAAAQGFERLIVQRKRSRPVSAVDARKVTAAQIARRVIEQRGVQALRSLAANLATPPGANPVAASESASAPTEPTPVPLPRASDPPSAGAAPASEPPTERGTRFARGGRVPIAVDVVGPLPGPAVVPQDLTRRVSQAPDPRREAEVGDEPMRLVAEIVRSGVMSDAVANRLLGAGERAIAAAFRYFPGPTKIDRTDTQARLPPVSELGPLLRLVLMFRHAAAPYLVEQLESIDPEQRYFATLALGEIVHPSALPRLTLRLFDSDFPTRMIAVDVLRAYRRLPEFDQVVRSLRAIVVDASASAERRRVAAKALGELRDAEAVPALLVALGDADAALATIAQRALVVLARQDFGNRVNEWRDWWERAAGRHRIEWLMEGLLHADATIRHEASEELKKLTGQFFGYYFNLPRREREKAHRRYVEWWEREGRSRMAR